MSSIIEFIEKHTQWKDELILLCALCDETELEATIKWGIPTYTINGKNVLALIATKKYVGIWFYNGVFLKDSEKKLHNANETQTKGLMQWRFTSMNEIEPELVKRYYNEAIENEKLGKRIKIDRNKPFSIPTELQNALKTDSKLNEAFTKLSKAKQREFAEHITAAKREETRVSRLNKSYDLILDGMGLYDKYKK